MESVFHHLLTFYRNKSHHREGLCYFPQEDLSTSLQTPSNLLEDPCLPNVSLGLFRVSLMKTFPLEVPKDEGET